jgi:hypothetical protein
MFGYLLNSVFYQRDVPTVLSYFSYAFYPQFLAHKTLFVVEVPRIGKGSTVRVLQGLLPKGAGTVSLSRLITGGRFQFSGVEGKNLLINGEVKRKFRHDAAFDWSAFCTLFGGDILSLEPKGRYQGLLVTGKVDLLRKYTVHTGG